MTNKFKALLGRLGLSKRQPDPAGTRLGLLAIMKNESLNIREWVDHYRWQGVDKIFLIDNGSEDQTAELIKEDIQSGFIEYFWRPARHQQAQHYREVYKSAHIAAKVDWLVMADLDEFWFSPLGDLKKAIASVSADVDLIYANWAVFGSSGWIEHPPSLRANLVYRHPQLGRHCNTKWICRTRSIRSTRQINLHKVKWVDSRRVASDNEVFKLNHYITQSLHYFQTVKMQRGDASSKRAEYSRTLEYFEAWDKDATLRDDVLAQMVQRRKAA